MPPLDEHKLQRVLARFPWHRRRPRIGASGLTPIGVRTREGEQLWADAAELAVFADPGPALLCVALHADITGQVLVRSLIEHHAREQGVELPHAGPDMTRAGVRILEELLDTSGLDPAASLGPHALRELVTATWAIAAGHPGAAEATQPD